MTRCMGARWLAPLVLAACGPADEPTSDPAATRPDVFLIVVDTLRADHLGVYGHERPTSPNLDALARDGVWFRRAMSHSGWTLPSMASLLTGLYPHQHRVGRDPFDTTRYGRVTTELETLAETLADVGYSCRAVMNNTFLAPDFGLHQGFGEYDYVGATKTEHRTAEASVDTALGWLDSTTGPSFLMLHLMEPHLLYDPPDSVRGTFTGEGRPPVAVPFGDDAFFVPLRRGEVRLNEHQLDYVRRLYDEEILATDRAVGRFLDELRARGLLDDSYVIVTSDHGEEFLDHGSYEHGHTLYSELTRVPLIAHGPGLDAGRVDTLVQHVDLYRGILEVAGATPATGTSGEDLFAIARGEGPDEERTVLTENVLYGPPLAALVTERFRVQVNLQQRRAEAWEVDERSVETVKIEPSDARPLIEMLRQRRGGLDAVGAVAGPHVPSLDVFERLRELGYTEDR